MSWRLRCHVRNWKTTEEQTKGWERHFHQGVWMMSYRSYKAQLFGLIWLHQDRSDTSMTNIWKYSGAEQFGVWSVVRARQVTLEKRTDVCSAFPAVVTSSWVTAGGLILDERAAVSRQWLGVTGEEIPEPRGGRMTDVHRWCRPCTSWGNTHLQSFQNTQRIQAKFFNKMTKQLFASFTDSRLTLPVF